MIAGQAIFGFTGPIDSSSASRICGALNESINQGYSEFHLAFSSLGGLTADGIFVYNHLRASPIPVIIHATGNVASVAVAIFLAGSARFCSKHVLFMMHPTSIGPFGEGLSWERIESLRQSALAEEGRTESILRERASIPDEVLKARRFRDVHFSPEDAVKFGIAHEIKEFSLPSGARVLQI